MITLASLLLALMTANLQAHVSVAHHTSDPSTLYSSGTQPNRVVAAQSALSKCRRIALTQLTNGVCELISMDSIPIATAQRLLPKKDATPLYLWRFQNGEATVYLAGTVHILKESLYPLPQQYEDAYHATEKWSSRWISVDITLPRFNRKPSNTPSYRNGRYAKVCLKTPIVDLFRRACFMACR